MFLILAEHGAHEMTVSYRHFKYSFARPTKVKCRGGVIKFKLGKRALDIADAMFESVNLKFNQNRDQLQNREERSEPQGIESSFMDTSSSSNGISEDAIRSIANNNKRSRR